MSLARENYAGPHLLQGKNQDISQVICALRSSPHPGGGSSKAPAVPQAGTAGWAFRTKDKRARLKGHASVARAPPNARAEVVKAEARVLLSSRGGFERSPRRALGGGCACVCAPATCSRTLALFRSPPLRDRRAGGSPAGKRSACAARGGEWEKRKAPNSNPGGSEDTGGAARSRAVEEQQSNNREKKEEEAAVGRRRGEERKIKTGVWSGGGGGKPRPGEERERAGEDPWHSLPAERGSPAEAPLSRFLSLPLELRLPAGHRHGR